MKAIIETSKSIPCVTAPIWIAVDPKTESIKEVIKIKGVDKTITHEEDTVRCSIAVIDYKSKAEATYIAGIIRKAIEAAPEFVEGN